jgi:UDP-N-acetyl-D-mannosaminuronic acid dehydrogenase
LAERFEFDVCVIGGAGHVGFPLAVAFASRGLRVCIFDIDTHAVDLINSGIAPFLEPGVDVPLAAALADGLLVASTSASRISWSESLVVVVGTPVDEFLSPDPGAVLRAVGELFEHMKSGQLVVLRSTVFPGVTRRVERLISNTGLDVDLAFCPERIAEGEAMTELYTLPQIVSARQPRATQRASDLFGKLTDSIIELEPEEAELAKLFTNSWRYIKFAAANQYYVMANDLGLDFSKIRQAMMQEYPRAADLPRAGFAAGPCLFKDTMQLASVTGGTFALGHSAMLVNEGLPDYLVKRIEAEHDLSSMTVGILGMAFKADSDDRRSSLSYRLKRLLTFQADRVLTTDPYVSTDPSLVSLDRVLRESDLLVIGAPHHVYRTMSTELPVVDVWNLLGQGSRV